MSRLQMIPERAYMDIFRDLVDEYLLEVLERHLPQNKDCG